jgi:hypothetical protein
MMMMMMMMSVEQFVERGFSEETEVLGEIRPHCHFFHHKFCMT